ncbi:hypothetical protein [Acinetobacter nosocomialis]|uniref:hypothetical protein n=1 Tax=Acinetobacter nosocomialis TaxID=106654 RepID=UPI0034CE63C3
MTDLNKERELYESVIEKTQGIKMEHLVGISFNAEANQYEISGEKWACELTDACEELNTGWFIWQECVKAKTQAVPDTHVVVPKVANKKMVNAGYEAHDGFYTNGQVQDVYQAMIKASESGAEG